MATRKKPSSHKREREFKKRQREVKKAEKAAMKRERRSNRDKQQPTTPPNEDVQDRGGEPVV